MTLREIVLTLYSVESVSKFELKTDKTEGWVEQSGVNSMLH